MVLYALNNPGREVPRVEGIVLDSSIGTREVRVDGFKYEDRGCTRVHLSGHYQCFVFDSQIEIENGARVRFYEHDASETGTIIYLAGLEILSSNPVLRKAMPIYDFKD